MLLLELPSRAESSLEVAADAAGGDVMKMEEEDPELKLSVLGRLRRAGLATLPLLPLLPPPPPSSMLSGEERKAESAAVVPLLPLSVPLSVGRCVAPEGSSSPSEFPELSVEAALLGLLDSSDSTVLSELLYRLARGSSGA